MKKLLLTIAAVTTVSVAIAPDFSDPVLSGSNIAASSATSYQSDVMVSTQDFTLTSEGRPDTTYIKSFHGSSGPDDTLFYYQTHEYFDSENYYTRNMYFPSFTGEGMDLVFASKFTYNEKALITSCSTFVGVMDNNDTSIVEYHYDTDDNIIKTIKTQAASPFMDADSVLYTHDASGRINTATAHYELGDNANLDEVAQTLSTYSYVDNALKEITISNMNKNDSLLYESRIVYDLNTSPVVHTKSTGTKTFELSMQSGRVLHLTDPSSAQCTLISPLGRVLRPLKLSTNGAIIGWNEITNGYYLLHIRQGQQTSILPFVK